MIEGTYFGLKLKAVGRNPKSAYILGIPTWQNMNWLPLPSGGVFAGLAGRGAGDGRLSPAHPSISSGYGYLGLMVALLVGFRREPRRARGPVLRRPQRGIDSAADRPQTGFFARGRPSGNLVLFCHSGHGVRGEASQKTKVTP